MFLKFSKKKEITFNVLQNDIFLVSYPKSGNTWLRFILANLLNKNEEINFTNIHQYSAEEGKIPSLKDELNKQRFVKSHSQFNSSFPKIIYIVRDGRDVYVSYYHYLKNNLPPGTSFKEFLANGPFIYGRWSEHVFSWLDNCKNPLLLIKYEDMHRDPLNTMGKVIDFIGLEVDNMSIKIALEKSCFDHMRNLEKTFGRGEYKTGPDIFMRKGEVGDWQKYFHHEEKKIFKELDQLSLTKLQYEDSPNW